MIKAIDTPTRWLVTLQKTLSRWRASKVPRLNQIVVLVASKKGRAASALAEQQSHLAKLSLLEGISRQYQTKADDGEQLPSEHKRVQVKALAAFNAAAAEIGEVLDLVLTQDVGNTGASSDIVVGNVTIIKDCPVSYLLFLEKKLKEIEVLIGGLPTLDPGDLWHYDSVSDCYASGPKQTIHTRKVPKNHIKAEATDKHPAQVETYMEDIVVGYWNTTRFSGAIPAQRRNDMLTRVRQLQDAVKIARESANSLVVEHNCISDALFRFIRTPVEHGA